MLVKKNRMAVLAAFVCTLFSQLLYAQVLVTPTPASARMASMAQRSELLNDSVLNSNSFRNIGPSIMSGRVVDIEANPEDPTEFYVAYDHAS